MSSLPLPRFSAFQSHRLIARGDLPGVAESVATLGDEARNGAVLVLDDRTGRAVDLDLRGDVGAIRTRAAQHPMAGAAGPEEAPTAPVKRKRGRPSLGVVAREVTLLPRHWDWLDAQGRSASAILRELVDKARKDEEAADGGAAAGRRRARDAAFRALSALAGDLPLFETAIRALFADDREGFAEAIQSWPEDVRAYALERAFAGPEGAAPPSRRV